MLEVQHQKLIWQTIHLLRLIWKHAKIYFLSHLQESGSH